MSYLRVIVILFSLCLQNAFSWTVHAQITHYTTENSGIASNYVEDIKIADDGTAWVVHANTGEQTGLVSAFDGDTWTVYYDLPEIYDAALYGNVLVLATRTGVYQYHEGVFERIEALGEFDCHSIQIKGDTLWAIIYPFGYVDVTLSKCNLATDTLEQNWLVQRDTHLLGIDENGALWCKSDGLYRYDGTRWQWFRDVDIDRSYLNPSYGFIPDLATDDDGNIWLGVDSDCRAITFDGTMFYQTVECIGNVVVGQDGTKWCFRSDVLSRLQNSQKEEMFNSGSNTISCFAVTDSLLWVGCQGATTISSEYLLAQEPHFTLPFSFEPLETVPESHVYGDDFTYFPLHIGDTWTYDRELRENFDITHTDTVVNTVIDTITVDEEVCFKFLSGEVLRAGQDSLVYENSTSRFDFNDPEDDEYVYYSYYSPLTPITRTFEPISVPAGEFMAYRFGFGTLGGELYAISPDIGIVFKDSYNDVGSMQHLRLTSAVVGGRTIDQITPVEHTPQPYLLDLTAYPNPFNPATTIGFTLPAAAPVTLTVYTIGGQKVTTLVDGMMNAGAHEVVFDGSGFASGIYIYRLESPGYGDTGKMLLMK